MALQFLRNYGLATLILFTWMQGALLSQPAPPPQPPPKGVRPSWDELLIDVIPQNPVDPVLTPPQQEVSKKALGQFENHFFFESRMEYLRSNAWFTGQPTAAGVINAPPTSVFNPAGVPYPAAFQPSANSLYEFMNFGTHGWLSSRVDSNFSVRYRQDLTHLDDGSVFQSQITLFPHTRRLELLAGSVEVKGEPGDGALARASLVVGRQNQYTTDWASFDGVTFHNTTGRFTYSIFGGRRFTYFDDPVQRSIGGSSFLIRLKRGASLEYQNLFYVRGSHRVTVRKSFERNLTVSSFVGWVGGHFTNFDAQAMWLPRDGKTSVRLDFFQQLTDKDFTFDYTSNVTHRSVTHQPLLFGALNLGFITPYSQALLDARQEIRPWFRAGGSIALRRLTAEPDQGPFNDSFDDYRANLQIFPVRGVETFWEYHLRDTHRRTPLGALNFDDVSIAGETREQDFRAELRWNLGRGRLQLSTGAFYRNIDLQDRFFYVPNAITRGVIGGFNFRVDRHTRLYANYSLDDDYYIFRPDIQRAQVLRIGWIWKY